MKKILLSIGLLYGSTVFSQDLIKKIGGSTSANGAEIVAFDKSSKKLYSVAGSVIEYYDISSQGAIGVANTLNSGFVLSPDFEALPNSVAIKDGVVACAWAVVNKTSRAHSRGIVTFHNAASASFIDSVLVGYLPDMICFSPNGKYVLTANEGEPNSYGQPDSFDPEGSVSIIDISTGFNNAVVKEIFFSSFNAQKQSLQSSGVRLFGPNATVAQDLEPEYITFNADGSKAIVTLQENNALAEIDILSATVNKILPLGLKDHNANSSSLDTYQFENLPSIGTTLGNQTIKLGGFSGLHYLGKSTNGNHEFITHTDRGPNGEPTGVLRPFMLPDFSPEIIKFELEAQTGKLNIIQRVNLKYADGKAIKGLPNLLINNNGNTPNNDETPVDLKNQALPLDSLGGDFEGIVVNPTDNSYWMVDEYRPAIYNFNSAGVLINRYVPQGTAAAAGKAAGYFGIEALPSILGSRRQNRGFEAVALNKESNKLYAFVQSPLRNPASLTNANLNAMANIRIVEFDINTKTTTAQYLYPMDNPNLNTPENTRADKIGDAVYSGNNQILVVERDDDALASGDPLSNIEKKIYKFSIAGATNINGNDSVYKSINKSIDQMSLAELQQVGLSPIKKELYIDLAKAGYNDVEKVEGLALIDSSTIAVINDNDFEVGGVAINSITGTFTPDPNPEPIVLGILKIRSNGFDASDRDLTSSSGKINIKKHPVYGMYMPDAIASFSHNNKSYFLTANEGDSRDYRGFSEEIRVGASAYILDPMVFPNASELKNNANLGRLQLTNATGDIDNDGDIDQIHALGSRSFSIWDEAANLIYDSGDELEQTIAKLSPSTFNSDGTNASFDSRSDNKGSEPEGVSVAQIGSNKYAFIGLERVGDIMVYNINNPRSPKFVQWADAAEDISPEGLLFIDAIESPTSKPLIVVAFEVSKSIAVYQIGDDVTANSIVSENISKKEVLYCYPNPTNYSSDITLSQTTSGVLYNNLGLEIMTLTNNNTISTKALNQGRYTFKSERGEFVKILIK